MLLIMVIRTEWSPFWVVIIQVTQGLTKSDDGVGGVQFV